MFVSRCKLRLLDFPLHTSVTLVNEIGETGLSMEGAGSVSTLRIFPGLASGVPVGETG